jgi:hypothetical protein
VLFGIGKTKASNQFKRIAASLYKVGLFVNKIIMKNRKRKPLDKRSRLLRLKFKLGLFEKIEQMLMLLTLRKKPCFSDDKTARYRIFTDKDLDTLPYEPIYISFDFNNNPMPAVVCQCKSDFSEIRVLKDFGSVAGDTTKRTIQKQQQDILLNHL